MGTTRGTFIEARFASTRRNLDEIIDRLTPELLNWTPAEGMRSVLGQLVEIASVEIPLVPMLKTGTLMPEAELEDRIGDMRDFANLRRLLIDVRQETLDYLDTLSDSDLAEEVACNQRWFGSLWLPRLPRAELFLNIAEHEVYHVGQLTAYLWMRGDDPYQW